MAKQVKPADVAGGRQGLDSYLSDTTSNDALMAQWDKNVAERRAAQAGDASASPNPAQQRYFQSFNNMQEDAATGRAGYNRQWVPLLQSLSGKRVNMAGSGLPTETYADPTHSGTLTRQSDDDVATLRSRAQPMPEGHEEFLQRLYGSDPPDFAKPAPAPPATPKSATLLPQQPALGAVAALARQLRGTS
jgi:hypothetical protein